MIEVEIKVQISDPQKIRKRFEEQGGKYIISLSHEDTYYNMPKKLRDFRKTDEALRIRKSTEYDKQNESKKQTNNYLTYKGAKLDNSTKTREEIETLIDDGEKLKKILDNLGFRAVLTIKKERDLYHFDYEGAEIEALIDYIPILESHFIEVEIQAESSRQIELSRDLLFDFLSKFQIEKKDSIRKSYLELILEKLGSMN
ncbi:MAG: class IV adenylate cyclase [Candidatus Lokiarchaeota archaeon]|nr:class IV adenylate cyclase [Candidatus Lokiarchaeota archaeon]